jgi:hypothetical protein
MQHPDTIYRFWGQRARVRLKLPGRENPDQLQAAKEEVPGQATDQGSLIMAIEAN